MPWWFKQKVHSSWRIALACACFVGGVASAQWWQVSGWFGLLVLPCLLLSMACSWRIFLLPISLLATGLGVSFGSVHIVSRTAYAQFVGVDVLLVGRVKEDIGISASGSKSIQLDSVTVNGIRMPGTVLVSSRSSGGALRGDYMYVKGSLGDAFGSFPATLLVSTIEKVERIGVGDAGRMVRDGFTDRVREVIPEPEASLGVGFLTGQKSALDQELFEAMKIAGLTHIVVASGYNLTILVRLARRLFMPISKYSAAVAASLMVLMFMTVTGLSPSMTRAGLVSGLSLLSWYYGHGFHPLVLLPIAAAITVLFQPSYVWGDLGWQLSFSAFAGVMLVGPLMQAYFFGSKEPGVVRGTLGETIAAHIVTVPVIALSFGVVSNVAIIANILVVPFVPLAMLLVFLCGIGVFAGVPFIELLAGPTTALLTYMQQVAVTVAAIPWAQSELPLPAVVWLIYAVIVLSACYWMWRRTKFDFRSGQTLY